MAKYVRAIIAVGIVALIVGAGIGYLTGYRTGFGVGKLEGAAQHPSQPKLTFVSGNVSHAGGIPPGVGALVDVFFDDRQIGGAILGSVIFQQDDLQYGQYQVDGHYQVYLRTNVTYVVTISYFAADLSPGLRFCPGVPDVITPTGWNYSQNIRCR